MLQIFKVTTYATCNVTSHAECFVLLLYVSTFRSTCAVIIIIIIIIIIIVVVFVVVFTEKT